MEFSPAGNETASRLTGPAFIGGFVLCSLAAGWLLFSNRQSLVKKEDLSAPDAVSDAYLRARSAKNPRDMALKYQMARRAAESGRYSQARTELSEVLSTSSPERNDALRLELDLALQRVFSQKDPQQQQAAIKALVPRLEDYYRRGIFNDPSGKPNFSSLERAAQLAEWGARPQLSLKIWERLAQDLRSEKAAANMIRLAKYQADYPALYRGLKYMSYARPLTASELGDMYFAKSGMPDSDSQDMLAYYRDYLGRYPKEAAVWDMYLFMLEGSGNLPRTLEAAKEREKALGYDVRSRNKIAELYWRIGDEDAAFGALEPLAASAPPSEIAFWQNYSELAWRLRRDKQAYDGISVLFKQKLGGEVMPERLAILKRESGEYASASSIALQAWQVYQKPRFLILALDSAISSGDKALVRRAYKVAHSTETVFAESDNYWVLKAAAIMSEAPREEVLSCFETALRINPDSPRAKRAMLWYLVETGWRQKLSVVLPQWEDYAQSDGEMWFPYAMGYEQVGQMKESVKWYNKAAAVNDRDPVFLAHYANALISAGYTWRGRRVLARAEALLDFSKPQERAAAFDIFQIKLNSDSERHSWKKQQAMWKKLPPAYRYLPETARAMVASALDSELPERAKYLAERVFKKSRLPDWQRFVLATNDKDNETLRAMLSSTSTVAGLPCSSVADGYARLGESAKAYSVSSSCLAENPSDPALRRQTFELARKNSGLARLYYSASTLGKLEVYGPALSAMRASENSSYSVEAEHNRLGSVSSGGPDFRGKGRELNLQAGYSYASDRTRLDLAGGFNARDDADGAPYGKGRISSGQQMRALLEVEANAVSEETQALRVLGLRDSVAVGLEWDVTVREFMSTKAGLRLYRERWGRQIGQGYFAEAMAGTRLRIEDPEWTLYLSASTLNNTASALSDHAVDYYHSGISPHDVVPREYTAAGVGMVVGNLLPPPLQKGGFAWQLGLWNGAAWPDSKYSYYAKLSVNAALAGRTRLFADAYYGNTGQNSPGEENKGVAAGLEITF